MSQRTSGPIQAFNTGTRCSNCQAPVENDSPGCLACGAMFNPIPQNHCTVCGKVKRPEEQCITCAIEELISSL